MLAPAAAALHSAAARRNPNHASKLSSFFAAPHSWQWLLTPKASVLPLAFAPQRLSVALPKIWPKEPVKEAHAGIESLGSR